MEQKPKGLKRSKVAQESNENKKHKQMIIVDEVKEDVGSSKNDEGVTVGENVENESEKKELKLAFEGETDDFEELKEIYNSALLALAEGDEDQGKTLLQGSVHECDRLLRQGTHEKIQDSEFHRVYGDSLRELGVILRDEKFLDASIDRYDIGLEKNAQDYLIYFNIAKCYIQMVYLEDLNEVKKPKTQQYIEKSKENIEKGMGYIEKNEQKYEELLDFAQFLQKIASKCMRQANYLCNNLAIEKFNELQTLMNGEKHEVLIGKGLCLMSIGIEKTEENKKKEAKTKLEESIQLIENGIKLVEQDNKQLIGEYSCHLGESLIHFANLLPETKSEKIYEKAIENLKKSQELVPAFIPEALQQFIEDFENGGDDNDNENDDDDENESESEN